MADNKINLNNLDFSGVQDIDKLDFSDVSKAGAPEDVSKTESFLRGAAQGGTLGFSDELAGGAQAAYDVATDPNKLMKDYLALYQKHRDESRANFKAAEEANPMTSFAGNLAGGLGAGVVAAPFGAGEAAAGLGRIVAGGAGVGATAGLGSSEADLTRGDLKGAATDAGTGAVAGSIGAGVLGAAGKGIKKGFDVLKGTKFGEQLALAANPEIDLSHKGIGAFKEGVKNYLGKTAGELGETMKGLGTEKENLLKAATEQGKIVNNKGILTQTKQALESILVTDPEQLADKRRALTAVNRALTGQNAESGEELIPALTEISPELADKFRRSMGQMAKMGERSIKTGEVQAPINEMMGAMSKNIETAVPGYETIQGKYAAGKTALSALGLEDISPKDPEYATKLYNALSNAGKESEIAITSDLKFKPFIENLKKANPELGDRLEQEFAEKGKILDIGRVASREGFPGSRGIMSAFGGAIRGEGLKGANYIARTLNDPSNIPLVGNALDTKFGASASKFTKDLATAASSSVYKRNAIIFTLMQNPDFRGMIDQLEPDSIRPSTIGE